MGRGRDSGGRGWKMVERLMGEAAEEVAGEVMEEAADKVALGEESGSAGRAAAGRSAGRGGREAARTAARQRAKKIVSQLTVEEQMWLLNHRSPGIKRLGIPEYNWWNEALHGVARAGTATVFPAPIALAATFNEKLIREIGGCIADEGRAKYNEYSRQGDRGIYKGLTYWSPNINIFRDPRWGRGHETFGEDPFLTGVMGRAFIEGLQGEDERFLKAAACVKHFAVHSGPEALRHEFDARVSQKDLWETYLPAFETCVKKARVEGVMGGYSSLNGQPLCANRYLMEEILRKKWGFEGYYVSDCWAVRDFHEHHMVTATQAESAAMALNAGCDINCGNCYEHLPAALSAGLIRPETVEESCVRALTTRILLGLFEKTPWDSLSYEDVDTKEAEALNLRAAEESIVLLKNNGILPLDKEKIGKLAVIGPNADSSVVLRGNYHGTASHYITVLEGVKREASGKTRIFYSSGCDLVIDREERLALPGDRIAEAVAIARRCEAVILCVGLDERYEGEAHHISTGECIGGDKEDLLLPAPQRELAEALLALDTPVILCCMTGSAMDLSAYAGRAAAILQTWYTGATGGLALARILFGEAAPSGKLPVTFYGNDYRLPEFTDYSMKNRTYRYVEDGVLYPFGYGLTYGKVEVQDASWDRDSFSVICTVENISKRRIAETITIYKKNKTSPLEVRNCALCGFAKVDLEPGERMQVEVPLWEETFTVVNEDGQRITDGKYYTLWVGTHGPDERSRELTGTEVLELEIELE